MWDFTHIISVISAEREMCIVIFVNNFLIILV